MAESDGLDSLMMNFSPDASSVLPLTLAGVLLAAGTAALVPAQTPAAKASPGASTSKPSRIRLPAKKLVLFLTGNRSHGYGAHEYRAGNMLMARLLEAQFEGLTAKVFPRNVWPKPAEFAAADSVVIFCNGGGGHLVNKHLDEFDALMKRGVGAAFLHYGVETVPGKPSAKFSDWIGGHFARHWSVNPHWVAEFRTLPDHPISRGVKPFAINDEWYFHMRFRPNMTGVTPILSAVAPASTMRRKDGPHSGNPAVREAVRRQVPQHTAWAYQRADGGRGFGFTGLHVHWNFKDDSYRKLLLNAVAWTAKIEVPKTGVFSARPTQAELEANQDYAKPKPRKKRASKKKPAKKKPAKKKPAKKKPAKKKPAVKKPAVRQPAK